ncbi:MAG: aminoacyl--tRNA ligase-related protein [Propylenella sp.]
MELLELDRTGKQTKVGQLPWLAGQASAEEGGKRLRELGWLSSEPVSDAGHISYGPVGSLLLRLMQRHLCALASTLTGAAEITTPLLFESAATGVAAEAGRFFDQMYHVGGYKKPATLVMRPGGDFGAFSLAARLDFRRSDLPWRVFECGRMFRRLQRGQVRGLQTLRAFSLLDYHAICADIDQLWEELGHLLKAQRDAIARLGFPAQLVFEVERSFFENYRERYLGLLDELGCSAFVALLPQQRNYWVSQHRFHDSDGSGLMDGQLDLENGRNYRIHFKEASGGSAPSAICHGSWGSVERWLFRTVGRASLLDPPQLPRWLSPVQLRFLPCSDSGEKVCRIFEEKLSNLSVRYDVDRRQKSVATRVRNSFQEMVDTVAVVGDQEATIENAPLPFRRADGAMQASSLEQWVTELRKETSGYPFEPLWSGGLRAYPPFR